MSELLFECYNVPGICYGIDSIFGYHKYHKPLENGLIVNLGYQCCHIIPIMNNQTNFENTRRVNTGKNGPQTCDSQQPYLCNFQGASI